MESRNKFNYLRKTMPRGQILYDALKPYLHLEWRDRILDANCGFSPLGRLLLDDGFEVWGFDTNEECIGFLRKVAPSGRWLIKSAISTIAVRFAQSFSVLLLLGFGDIDFVPLLKRYSEARVVMLEVVKGEERYLCRKLYTKAVRFLADSGYKCVEQKHYDAELERGSERMYSIMVKQK